jgi:hypothetical protein
MMVNKRIALWAIPTGGDVAGFAASDGPHQEFSTWPQLPEDTQATVRQAAVGVAFGVISGQAAVLLLAPCSASPKALAPPHTFEGAFFFLKRAGKVL